MTDGGFSPDLSVVIPTHNRRALLLRTLEALETQTLAPGRFDVVVVMDSCTDGTETAIRNRSWGFALHELTVAARSAACARNAGARHARGQRLVFLDDDIAVEREFLAAHLSAAGPDGDRIVLGPVLPDIVGTGWFDEKLRGWWADRAEAQAHPGHRFGFTDLATGNVSIARADFVRLGGFNESIAVREDYELGWRAVAAGIAMTVAPGAAGHHRDESDLSRNLARVRAEGAADVAFAKLHPGSFHAMRVAGLAARTPSSRLLRVLGFDMPWLLPPVLAGLKGVLRIAERTGLRRVWERAAEAAWGFSYHRGAAEALGNRAALRAVASLRQPVPPRVLDVDLTAGPDAARRAVDRERPDELAIRLGLREIDRISAWPGMEPLGARHLDTWLRRHRGRWVRGVTASTVLPDLPPVAPDLPGSGWSVGELDLADWSLRPVRKPISLPLLALVRWGGEALGWIVLNSDRVRNGNGLQVARDAVLADDSLCDRLVRIAATGPQRDPVSCPPISVIVCSRDRTDSLAECLDALSRLDYPAYEVIVVDNAPSTDGTARLVADRPGVRYVREDRPGLDWARNRGLAEARHGLVAYTDDDTRADRSWLKGLARAFADPAVAAATGLVTPMELNGGAQDYFEFVYGGMGKGVEPQVWSLADRGPRGILWASGCGVGANMAFRRDVLAAAGGFDPALDVGTATRGGGDIEAFHRLLARGHILRYEPSAMVWHRHRTDWEGLARQLQDNGSGFGAYLLTAWRERTVPRRHIVAFALRDWIWGWQVRRLLGPGDHRRAFVRREIRGMISAPGRLRQARATAAALARSAPPAGQTPLSRAGSTSTHRTHRPVQDDAPPPLAPPR